MKLDRIHFHTRLPYPVLFEAGETATHYRNLIATYLDDNLQDPLAHHPAARDAIVVRPEPNIVARDLDGEESTALLSIVVNDEGVVTLTYYPHDMAKGCKVHKVNLHSPNSLQRIAQFANALDYEA